MKPNRRAVRAANITRYAGVAHHGDGVVHVLIKKIGSDLRSCRMREDIVLCFKEEMVRMKWDMAREMRESGGCCWEAGTEGIKSPHVVQSFTPRDRDRTNRCIRAVERANCVWHSGQTGR